MSSNNSTPLTDNAELPPIAEAKNTYQIEPAVDIQLVPFEKFYSSAETKEKSEPVEPSKDLMDIINQECVEERLHNLTILVQELQRRHDALEAVVREIRKERAG